MLLEPVKTKMPSEVAASPSPIGSWMKNPLLAAVPSKSPTTTPSVVRMPVSAAVEPLPWMRKMGVNGSSHGLESSFRIVPWPWPSATVAPVTFVTLTKNDSFASMPVSPLTLTSN